MTRTIVFYPTVLVELEAIKDYYEQQSGPKLANDFNDEFLRRVVAAAESPWMYVAQKSGLRRANLRKFPYNFLFLVTDSMIQVVVLRHHARHPSYGTGRA